VRRNLLEILDAGGPIRKSLHIPVPDDLSPIADAFDAAGEELYIVGGAVRDSLLGKTPKDYDLVTGAEPDRVIDIVSQDPTHRIDLTGKSFGVVRVKTSGGEEYEIATFRRDIGEGRRPDLVEFTTIEDDVNRRDLTINALFYDLATGEVVDYVGGIADVENGVVRAVGDPTQRFREDKLRILRAVRFAARLNSDLDPGTVNAIKHDNDLSGVSPERIRDEFAKAVASAQDGQHLLSMMDDLNLWSQVFPGLQINPQAPISKNFEVQVTFLLTENDIKDVTRVLRSMKYSSIEIDTIQFLLDFSNIVPASAPRMKKEFRRLRLDPRNVQEFASKIGLPERMVLGFLRFVQQPQIIKSQDLMAQGLKGPQIGQAINTAETEAFRKMTENTLRKYIKLILLEKKFSDFKQKKDQWFDVSEDELAKHRPDRDIDDEIFDLIDLAYKPIGGHINLQNADALPEDYDFFDTVDVDDDPDPDAVIFGQFKGDKLKLGGIGHDGAEGKQAVLKKKNQLMMQPGTFSEVSGAPAHLAIKAGIPVVTDEDKVRALIKKPLEWVGKHPDYDTGPGTDGWYYRIIGGTGKKFLKLMVGNV